MKTLSFIFALAIAVPQSGLAFEGWWNIKKAEEAEIKSPEIVNNGPKGMAYNGVQIIDSIPRNQSFSTQAKPSPYTHISSTNWANYDGDSDGIYSSFDLQIYMEGGHRFSLSPRLSFSNKRFSNTFTRPGEQRYPYYGWDNLEAGYKPLADSARQCIQKIEQFIVDLSKGEVEPDLANLFFGSIHNRPEGRRPTAMYFQIFYDGQENDKDTPKIARISLYENYEGTTAFQTVDENGDCDPKKLVEEFAVKMGTVQHEMGTISYEYKNDGEVTMEKIPEEPSSSEM